MAILTWFGGRQSPIRWLRWVGCPPPPAPGRRNTNQPGPPKPRRHLEAPHFGWLGRRSRPPSGQPSFSWAAHTTRPPPAAVLAFEEGGKHSLSTATRRATHSPSNVKNRAPPPRSWEVPAPSCVHRRRSHREAAPGGPVAAGVGWCDWEAVERADENWRKVGDRGRETTKKNWGWDGWLEVALWSEGWIRAGKTSYRSGPRDRTTVGVNYY
jgi:hypothetical protein